MEQLLELSKRHNVVIRVVLASHNTTIEASLTSTVTSLRMPGFLLDNGLPGTGLAALRTRLTT